MALDWNRTRATLVGGQPWNINLNGEVNGAIFVLFYFLQRTLSCSPLPSVKVNEGEPAVIWLSGLHIPESYLTALVQATCRKNGWPLDRSTLYTTVTKYRTAEEVTERAHSGCFVSGLYLEGASWDLETGCLRRPKPKVLVEELPILKVIPIEAHRLKLQVTC